MNPGEQKTLFSQWLNQHRALLFKVVNSYAFTDEDREDLFQEICLQVWRSVPAYRGEASVTTWLYRVALNTALVWTKRERKHREGRHSFDSTEHALARGGSSDDDRLQWLYDQISRLDEIDRSLALLLLDGYNYREMAEMLGISESNVGVKIHRIKKHLITRAGKD